MGEAEALRELMEADRWIDRVRAQRDHLPELAELSEIEDQLRTMVRQLTDLEKQTVPLRAKYDEAATSATKFRDRAHLLQERLANVNTSPKDLAALQHEVEQVQEKLSVGEDAEVTLFLDLGPLDEAMQALREDAKPLGARRNELLNVIKELQSTLDEEIANLQTQRLERAGVLSSGLLSRYETAMKRAGVSGASQIDGNRCDGCRIALAPLELDRWRGQASGDFTNCPECGRILLPC